MARKVIPAQLVRQLLLAFVALPFKMRLLIAGVALLVVSTFLIVHCTRDRPSTSAPSSAPESIGAKTVLFSVWNLENLSNPWNLRSPGTFRTLRTSRTL